MSWETGRDDKRQTKVRTRSSRESSRGGGQADKRWTMREMGDGQRSMSIAGWRDLMGAKPQLGKISADEQRRQAEPGTIMTLANC